MFPFHPMHHPSHHLAQPQCHFPFSTPFAAESPQAGDQTSTHYLKTKQKRKSAPKSKLGCVTCKERHVKCDETRPGCKRCARTGVVCGGYIQVRRKNASSRRRSRPTPRSSPSSEASDPVSSYSMSPAISDCIGDSIALDEVRMLDFFRIKAPILFPAPLDGEFWTNLLLQVSQQEPCVRYAMLAVSSTHSHLLSPQQSDTTPITILSPPPAALAYHHRATTALDQGMANATVSLSTTLMCYTLFIALEVLRGSQEPFVSHVRHGQRLIIEWRASKCVSYDMPQSTSAYNEDCLIEQHLVPFFAQQYLFADNLHNCDPHFEVMIEASSLFAVRVPEKYHSIEEAEHSWTQIYQAIVNLVQLNCPDDYAIGMRNSFSEDLRRLQSNLHMWYAAFTLLQARIGSASSRATSSIELEVRYRVTKIWLAMALTPEQHAFDDAFDSFRSLVEGSFAIAADAQINHDETSNVDYQQLAALVSRLAFTAIVSRDVAVRRKVSSLLHACIPLRSTSIDHVPVVSPMMEPWFDVELGANSEAVTPRCDAWFDMELSAIPLDPDLHSGMSGFVAEDGGLVYYTGFSQKVDDVQSNLCGAFEPWFGGAQDVYA